MPRYCTILAVVGGDVTTDSLQPPDHSRLSAEPVFRPRDQGGDSERYPLEYCARVWEDFIRALGRIEADFLQRSDTPEPGVKA
ncbi:hypothetical protein GCM10017744_023550 [Streptomyces antimycoticus]|uniref:Uncharacterized protein n=1 Tax=Streptomyces antimycoticus TaxID=68175 RepID=A0A4D4KKG5_9ACTN|nr:hypothetical protein SANT12839_078600 [Streptomyces antimycoticus]